MYDLTNFDINNLTNFLDCTRLSSLGVTKERTLHTTKK